MGSPDTRESFRATAGGWARRLCESPMRSLTRGRRIGPRLTAQFELDAGAVTVVLEGYVREHLEELASERVEF
jgi:hypothetical protein